MDARDRADLVHRTYLDVVRAVVVREYRGRGAISIEHVHNLVGLFGMRPPEGAGPELLNSIFTGWPRAKLAGWAKDKQGAAIQLWRIR